MGFDPARVVQLWAPGPAGGGTSGSGYRVDAELVLTAAHTVAGLPVQPADSPAPARRPVAVR